MALRREKLRRDWRHDVQRRCHQRRGSWRSRRGEPWGAASAWAEPRPENSAERQWHKEMRARTVRPMRGTASDGRSSCSMQTDLGVGQRRQQQAVAVAVSRQTLRLQRQGHASRRVGIVAHDDVRGRRLSVNLGGEIVVNPAAVGSDLERQHRAVRLNFSSGRWLQEPDVFICLHGAEYPALQRTDQHLPMRQRRAKK